MAVGFEVVGVCDGDGVVGLFVGFFVGADDGKLVVGAADGELVVGPRDGALVGDTDGATDMGECVGDTVMLGITGNPKIRLFWESTT